MARLQALEQQARLTALDADLHDPRLAPTLSYLQRICQGQAAWFWTEPHALLEGASPREVCHSGEEGIARVQALLGRLEHGLPV